MFPHVLFSLTLNLGLGACHQCSSLLSVCLVQSHGDVALRVKDILYGTISVPTAALSLRDSVILQTMTTSYALVVLSL